MKLRIIVSFSLVLALAGLSPVHAQNISTITVNSEEPHIAIPAGAAAKVNSDTGDGAANALLGFQYWKEDAWLLTVLASQAAEGKTISDRSQFGSFLLDPSSNGTSFYVSGNYTWHLKSLLIGPNFRLGGSSTAWEATINGAKQSVGGVVLYFSPAMQISSPTFGKPDNSYQIGGEIGWGVRTIANDLGQAKTFLSAPEVLGTTSTSFHGFEGKVFFRVNELKPYMRVSHYASPNGQSVPGLTDWQASFGVEVLSALFKK
jgi:opacity protein-like surface antigen